MEYNIAMKTIINANLIPAPKTYF